MKPKTPLIRPDKLKTPERVAADKLRDKARLSEISDYWGPRLFGEILKDAILSVANESADPDTRTRWLEIRKQLERENHERNDHN